MIACCSNCKYGKLKWNEGKLEDDLIICRRYAPKPVSVVTGDEVTEWEWPLAMPDDWCGEYATKL